MDIQTKSAIIHLTPLLTGFIGPFIAYIMVDDEYLKENAAKSLNWQITFTIYLIFSTVLAIIIIGILTGAIVFILNIVFCIKGALSASKGELWEYPITYSFL